MTQTPQSNRSVARGLRRLIVFALLVLIVLVLGLAGLLLLPAPRMLLMDSLAHWLTGTRLEALGTELDLHPTLARTLVRLGLIPVAIAIALTLTFSRRKAAWGLALLVGLATLWGSVAWLRTRHMHFDVSGRPIVYLSFRRDGVVRSYQPGIDRVTGRAKLPVTADRVEWFSELARQPVREVDPAVFTHWFDANSGGANLWYVPTGSNSWIFFNRPHFHEQLKVEVQPVTPEIMARWQEVHLHRLELVAAEQRRRDEEARQQAEVRRAEENRLRAIAEAKARAEAEAETERRRQLAERLALEEARMRVETEARLRLEEAQRLQAAEAAAELARRQEEEKIQAAQIAAERAQQETTQRRIQAEIEERRRREQELARRRFIEASASPADLEAWDWARFVETVLPTLDPRSPDLAAFEDGYGGRRFRFRMKVASVEKRGRSIVYGSLPLGRSRLDLAGAPPAEAKQRIKAGLELAFVATVDGFESGTNGCIRLSRIVALPPEPVPVSVAPPAPAKPKPARTSIGLPINERGETPVVSLFMMPFRLVGGIAVGAAKSFDSDVDQATSFQVESTPVQYPTPGLPQPIPYSTQPRVIR